MAKEWSDPMEPVGFGYLMTRTELVRAETARGYDSMWTVIRNA